MKLNLTIYTFIFIIQAADTAAYAKGEKIE